MQTTITITRKGQTTLPVEFRRRLGLSKDGGTLQIRLDENKDELIIQKAVTAASLSEKLSQYIKSDTAPLQNVDEFYQENRQTKEERE